MDYSEKQLIIFDVDETLTPSKSAIEPEIAEALCNLLNRYRVAIISGGMFEQLKTQVVDHLPCEDTLSSLFVLPTSGASLYTYTDAWTCVYEDTLTLEERTHIINSLNDVIAEVLKESETTFGERIEDRESQITFSGLGQEAPLELKEKWDPGQVKRKKIQHILKERIPGYRVGIGGSTSIDITKEGRDKGYGIKKLMDHLDVPTSRVLFIGDALFPGGNDYPARTIGIDFLETDGPKETQRIIEDILAHTSIEE